MEKSIFSKIVDGEINSYKVLENEYCLAFLDIFPLQKGHTLVIPKTQCDNLFELEDSIYLELMRFTKKVALGLSKFSANTHKRIGQAVVGLEVPHAHIHLIPINNVQDINFSEKKLQFSEDEMKEIAAEINRQII